jgi:hypothetical protein
VKRVRLGPKKILITPSANSGKNSNGSVSWLSKCLSEH